MRSIPLGRSGLAVPAVAVGCMRWASFSAEDAARFLGASLDLGLNFFDHADIYGRGAGEERFAEAVARTGTPRDRLVLQSKCGIVPGKMYDFSRGHILASVDGILARLKTDHLDVLLLHRPDALMEPDEVADAFERLATAGKVRHFGVSNMGPGPLRLLRRALGARPLVANQIQLSIAHATAITAGLNLNMGNDPAVDRDGGVVDYCRFHAITIQPWSPLQHGFFGGPFVGNPAFPELNAVLDRVAARHGVDATAVAFAWLLRHPAGFQPVTGTTNIERLRSCAAGAAVTLDRAEWYEILVAAGNPLP